MADSTILCYWCDESDPDPTESMPFISTEGTSTLWYHRECGLRNVLGGLKHQSHTCGCFIDGGDNDPPDGMSRRDEALEIDLLVANGKWSYG